MGWYRAAGDDEPGAQRRQVHLRRSVLRRRKTARANGAYVDRVVPITNSDPPNPVKASDAGNLVLRLIDNDIVPEPDDDLTTALYIVLLPQRVGGATLSTPPGLNGAHSYATYSDYDFPVDWDNDSVFYAWIRNAGSRAQISTMISDEIVEAMTDPMGNGWRVTPTNSSNWNEVTADDDKMAVGRQLRNISRHRSHP